MIPPRGPDPGEPESADQLRACEEYCRRQSYEVLERFHEEGESAKSTDRSQLQNLFTFCRLNTGTKH